MLRVLDSSVLIDFLRGRPVVARVSALRGTGDVPATTAVNVDEVVRGLRPGEESAARMLFAGLAVLPVDTDSAWRSGVWRHELALVGVTVHQADTLIAAVTATHRAVLCTGNPKDFPMTGLSLEHWPVGA